MPVSTTSLRLGVIATVAALTMPALADTAHAADDVRFTPAIDTGVYYIDEAADFNGDGVDDVIGISQNTVELRLNDGAGGFGPARVTVVGEYSPSGISVADLNGDGDLDVASSDSYAGVSILLGTAPVVSAPRSTTP